MFWEVSGCGVKRVCPTKAHSTCPRIWEPSCGRFRPPVSQRRSYALRTLDPRNLTEADIVKIQGPSAIHMSVDSYDEKIQALPPYALHIDHRGRGRGFGFLYLRPPPPWAPPTLYTLRFRVCPSLASSSQINVTEAFALGHDLQTSAFPTAYRDPLIFGAAAHPAIRSLLKRDGVPDAEILERCNTLAAALRTQIRRSASERGYPSLLNPLRTLVFAYHQPFWIDFANTGHRKRVLVLGSEDGRDVIEGYSMFFYQDSHKRPRWKQAGFEDTFTGIVQVHFERMKLPDDTVCAVLRVRKILKPVRFIPPIPSEMEPPPDVTESIASWPERIKEGALLPYKDRAGSWGELLENCDGEKVPTPLRLLQTIPGDVDLDSW